MPKRNQMSQDLWDAGWIGVDLDGTLAVYDGWKGPRHIGEPIAPMVDRVKRWITEGRQVKIFTARASEVQGRNTLPVSEMIRIIEAWCLEHIGYILPVTNVKDYFCIAIYDDRAYRVEFNTGAILSGDE